MNVAISWVLGALASILIAITTDWLRKPSLVIEPESPPLDRTYVPASFAQNARYLRVSVMNRQPQHFLGWIGRNAALRCEAEVTFYHLDGQDVFGRPMLGRWVDSPEPPEPMMVGSVGTKA